MSYTTEDLVRNHLCAPGRLDTGIENQAIVLGESDWVRFYNGAVDSQNFRVKSPSGAPPVRESVTFTDSAAILAAAPIARGSVTVASDSSLGTRYDENVDFVIDYDAASIHVKPGGRLQSDSTVTVWYGTCTVYARNDDYTLDAETGRLRRLASGAIAPRETVYIDYVPLVSTHDESLIRAAVLEANSQVAAEVDPGRRFGADPVLQAAATCAALAVVCRGSAGRALTAAVPAERAAAVWLQLAASCTERAEHLIRKFRPPHAAPSAPTRS